MQFFEKIQALRKDRGLSQESFAERIGVSRQAVAKWESGESLPEIDKLMLISDFFMVSIDSLVKDSQACSSHAAPVDLPHDAVVAFLLRAKKATYAGHGGETTPSRPSSHDLAYQEGDLRYYDTYLGGLMFAGEEALWKGDVPVWSMNYVGRTLDDLFSGDFLKEALSHASADLPYRGPRLYKNGDYTYHCFVNGSFDWYEGTEEIFAGDRKVFECRFHGGSIR